MESLRLIIELAAVILGSCYLYSKHWQRVWNWKPSEDPKGWAGHGIDTSKLQPRMEEVRQDHMAGRRALIEISFHRALIGFARKVVSQLRYFRNREEEHAHDHRS